MFEEFKSYIKKNNLFRKHDRILMAVSGGIDSMVMSHLFIRLGTEKGIAHCNFSLRGEESDLDEDLVRNFAEKNSIPFYSIRFNTLEHASANGISVQMAARELRYEWFEKIRLEDNFSLTAVAHNLNDNIETMLINLTRGTGLTGLSGMKPAGDTIIRPLLFASRERIEKYCIENDVPFREDKSNASTKYTRNKIRHLVIPVLKEINPSVEETLNETAGRLTGIDEIVSEYIDGIRSRTSIKKGTSTIFNVERLKKHQKSRALIFELFNPYGVSGSVYSDLIRLISGSTGKQIFTKTHRILRNRDEIIVTPLETGNPENHVLTSIEDLQMVQGIRSAMIIDVKPGYRIPRHKSIACIDSQKIRFPLIIRGWVKGDHFFPLGMNKKKKLSDYFIDSKYSLLKKEKTLILESAGKIVWIIGDRLDDRFKVTDSTSKILLIRLSRGRSSEDQPSLLQPLPQL
jgi:tRNA(Ile)-lysidine synthase